MVYNISENKDITKEEVNMTREQVIERLTKIYEASKPAADSFEMRIVVKDWKTPDGKKNRTYLAIEQTRTNSTHYTKKEYGYYDNIANEYVPGKHNVNDNFTFSGERF